MDQNCAKCGKLIKHGSAYMVITRDVECFENHLKKGFEVVSVLNSEGLVIFCVDCGNLFDANMLKEIIKSTLLNNRNLDTN